MKYISNKIVCGALSMLALLGSTSCGDDFLKEDAGHLYTDALLETKDGALAMAAALLLGERALSGMSPAALATVQIGTSALVALIAALVLEGGVRVTAATGTVWGTIIYLAIACSAAGFLLQNAALRRISAKSVALAQCVCPVLTALFSYLLLGERLSAAGFAGAALILLCVCAEISVIDP